ncbi:MAG TPA: PEP-CTERM sorting domain-containing protein [Armatimonadota bacterium]|jgi:hypothetical protein
MAWLKTSGIVMVAAMGAVSWGDARAQMLPEAQAQPRASEVCLSGAGLSVTTRFWDGRNATGSVPACLNVPTTPLLQPGDCAGYCDQRSLLTTAVRETVSADYARPAEAQTLKKGQAERAAVPEPGTLAMVCAGALPLLSVRRSRR